MILSLIVGWIALALAARALFQLDHVNAKLRWLREEIEEVDFSASVQCRSLEARVASLEQASRDRAARDRAAAVSAARPRVRGIVRN